MLDALHFLKIRQFWKININNKPTFAMDKLKKSKTNLLYAITLTVEKKRVVFLQFVIAFAGKKEKLLKQRKFI